MKRREFLELTAYTAGLAMLGRTAAGAGQPVASEPATAEEPGRSVLWYRQPASQWVEALPVGNGRMGAMVFGGVASERIQLNEETVWSGGPYDPTNPKGVAALPEIRRLVFNGENVKAHRLFGRSMFGVAIPQMQYQPLGDLWLTFPKQSVPNDHKRQLATDMAMVTPGAVSDYQRRLDLDEAVATVSYRVGAVTFKREVFASAVDDVVVVRLTADKPGQITFDASAAGSGQEQSDGDLRMDAVAPDEVVVRGRAISDQGVEGQVRYQTRVRVIAEGGTVKVGECEVSIRDADSVTILVAARTSYISYKDASGDPEPLVLEDLQKAGGKSYEELRRDHVAEHQRLFSRVSLDLGPSKSGGLPTDERLRKFHETDDPSLVALYFQFGRYLLLCSSRAGNRLPANLQGIWNQSIAPPWGSKFTTNINLEMNYWPAEVTNLGECAEPLFKLLEDAVEPGSRVAKVNYGAKGWVLHQNTDSWLACAPMDGPTWGTFATAGAWLCTHLWEHYRFSEKRKDLERFYPIMKGAAQFFLDTLVEHPQHKWLVTCPSTSPEHHPVTPAESVAFWDEVTNLHLKGTTICAGPTMDMSILRNLFQACVEAGELLGEDAEFRAKLEKARQSLAPLQIGKHGQLQEWLDDWDDPEDQHRHLSPLWGLYPGNEITPRQSPKFAAAAARLLEFRGDRGPGWTMAWKVCLWARLLDGERAAVVLRNLLTAEDKDEISYKDGGTYLNLMNAVPFQLDGNMGATAGIAEMLLQSHGGEIHLAPALPKAWLNGAAKGLRARGGFVVDMEWKQGVPREAEICSELGKSCRVRTSAAVLTISASGENVLFSRPEKDVVEFPTKSGETYRLRSS